MRRRTLNRTVAAAVMLLLLVLLSPATAGAEQNYIFSGHGWGHGIGMSQWGAYGLAEKGLSGREILAHYYRGATVTSGQAPANTIRVKLFGGRLQSKAWVEAPAMDVTTSSTGTERSIGRWRIQPSSAGLTLYKPGGGFHSGGHAVVRFTDRGSGVTLYGTTFNKYHAYRGTLVVYQSGSDLYVINEVAFDPTYVAGIAEMPSSWPMEALKAQAIAARSYALRSVNAAQGRNYDLYDSTASQVYTGLDKGRAAFGQRWKDAASSTRGEILSYAGSVISAYYHSTSGGYTENNEDVWSGSALAYLRAVPDPYAASSPWSNWSRTFTPSAMEQRLKAKSSTTFSGNLKGIQVLEKKGGRRVSEVRIVGTGTSRDVSGASFRSALGLPSTWWTLVGLSKVWMYPNPFTPNGDKVWDTTSFCYTLTSGAWVTIKVFDYRGEVRTVVPRQWRSGGRHYEGWTGTNNTGKVLADGNYRYDIIAENAGTRVVSRGITSIRGTSVSILSAWVDPNPVTPNGDGKADFTRFVYNLDASAKVTIRVLDARNVVRYLIWQAPRPAGRNVEAWTGTNGNGNVLPTGNYRYQIIATSALGKTSIFSGVVGVSR